MFLVGLTGGIASGKSTVAARFVAHGAELIDADVVAREVVLPGTPTWKRVVDHFGSEVVDDAGFIDRPALARIVFADVNQRAVLNQLTHPPVMAAIADRLEVLTAFDGLVVLDVPLLVEAGADRSYDAIVVVATRPEVQIRRLVEGRALSEAEAWRRVEAQAPLEAKLAAATHVIWNEGTLDELRQRADDVATTLTSLADRKVASERRDVPGDR